MRYAICSYALTFGGAPKIILNAKIGLIMSRVVLSVRGCSLKGICERNEGKEYSFALIS